MEENDDDMKVDVDECSRGLLILKARIREHYPNLQILVRTSGVGQCFLSMASKFLSSSDRLTHLPTFHVIATESVICKDLFDLRLLAFNGKHLQTEKVGLNNLANSKLLPPLNAGRLRLCQGLPPDFEPDPAKVFRAYEEQAIVARSQFCQYVLGLVNETNPCCSKCQFLLGPIKGPMERKAPIADLAQLKDAGKVILLPSQLSVIKAENLLEVLVKEEPLWEGSSAPKEEEEEEEVDKEDCKQEERRSRTTRKRGPYAISYVSSEEEEEEEERMDEKRRRPKRKKGPYEINYLSEKGDEVVMVEEKDTTRRRGPKAPYEIHYLSEEEDTEGLKTRSSQAVKEEQSCPKCHRVYTSKQPYDNHILRCVHGRQVKPPKSKPLTCVICLRRFGGQKQLQRHMDFHRSKHPASLLEQPVKCPACEVEVKSRLELNQHYQKCHDKGKGCCIECLEVYDAQCLRRHLYNKHFYSVKGHLCQLCGSGFASPLKLRVHISSAHDSTGTSCVCEQCGKVFPHKIKLNHHIYHNHNKTRVYPCHSCDKTFTVPMAFYKHVKIHSMVKPFSCDICGYRAVRKDNVRQHVKKVHKVERNEQDHVVKDGKLRYEALERKKAMKAEDPSVEPSSL